jgi:hypothetical protein
LFAPSDGAHFFGFAEKRQRRSKWRNEQLSALAIGSRRFAALTLSASPKKAQ